MVICSNVLLMFLLLTEILVWSQIFSWAENDPPSSGFTFGYTDLNGPHMWKALYPDSSGNNQSPINIKTNLAMVVQESDPLRWNGYNETPLAMLMENNGTNLVVSTTWGSFARPYIDGGCLPGAYDFHSMIFHWGCSNEEGSEHTLDYVRYAMELQVLHLKRGFETPSDAILAKDKHGIAIVSFFFEITNADNPYLDHIVTNLWRVSEPGTQLYIPPFPLEWIFSSFQYNYYTYRGSLTQPPCSEIVTWIVQPEPIAVSSSQVAEFRKIRSHDGPILTNCRPVQKLNDREILVYE